MHFLGKNLRYLRKKSSQNQDDIAFLVHKGQTTIGNWENGVSEPSLGDLLIISNYFGISVDILLKTDLTEQAPAKPGEKNRIPSGKPLEYDHDKEEISMVQENPMEQESGKDRLYPILEEIRSIRSEIEHIKSRLPGDLG